MKHLRLVALVFTAAAWTAVAASACDMTKGASACGMHTKGTKATAASASAMDCCAGKGTSASAASASGCSEHAAHSAAMAKSGSCGNHASAAAMSNCSAHALHGDCSVCLDEATCDNDLRAAGVRSQVVALRNGAMIVYTADNADNVRSLQTTVARYNEHIMGAYANASEATLCGECKAFRGAMASGKFTRELVNVKNGCQILLTSSDRTIVRKIHDMTAAPVAARVHV